MKFIVVSDKTIERSIAESQILDDIEKSKKKDTIINKNDNKDTKDTKVITTPPPENKVVDKGPNLDDISKYSNPNSSKNITMKDFGPQNPSGKVIPKPKKPLMKNSPAAKAGIPIELSLIHI